MTTSEPKRVISATSAPIFFAFFVWGFGTGAQHVARPLFANELTGSAFLVAVVIGMNAIPRMFTGPITGFLTDRFGRKPLVLFGTALRGATNVGQFLTGSFIVFLILEFVGQIGVSMFNTSSNVLLSDVTTTSNRGRALALRQMSLRLGFVAGPFAAGIVAASVSLPAVFLINGASKVIIVVTVWFLVRETHQRPQRAPAGIQMDGQQDQESSRKVVGRAMRTPSFIALALTITGFAMTQTALLQALLPLYVQEELGVGDGGVGFVVSLAAFVAFMVAFPNGMIADRFGRKASLVPGLMLLALASTVLSFSETFVLVMVAVAIQGSGEGMTQGTTHTYAMDIAPPDHRGAFLGVVMMFQAAGAFLGPIFIGALYNYVSHEVAFATLAIWMGVAAVAMAVLGKETAGRRFDKRAAAGMEAKQ